MGTRLQLHSELVGAINDANVPVYFQPPEDLRMRYPCVRYTVENDKATYADNTKYFTKRRYTVLIIDPEPDSIYIDKIASLPYSAWIRSYRADGLYHHVFDLFY